MLNLNVYRAIKLPGLEAKQNKALGRDAIQSKSDSWVPVASSPEDEVNKAKVFADHSTELKKRAKKEKRLLPASGVEPLLAFM